MPVQAVNLMSEEPFYIEQEKRHLIQSYGRYDLRLERGKGCYVYGDDGRRYLDFMTGIGVNALGHQHPRIVKAMREQMAKLVHCSNLYYHPYQGPLAERLAKMSGLDRVFFTNSGAESVEGALKIAKGYGRRKSAGKHELVALNNSFAGRTLAAVAVTGQAKHREPFEPLIPGVRFVDVNDIDALEAAVTERTAGIILEPIQGEGGFVEVSSEFAHAAAGLAAKHDALLIFDEIQSGLGRTGAHFAFKHWHLGNPSEPRPEPIHPDLLLVAKPLAAGLPLGAVIANEKAAAMITPGLHGSTFGGGALACRAAIEFLDVMEEILPAMREISVYFRRRLDELAMKHDFVVGVRGRGLMLALELSVPGKWTVPAAQQQGLLINCTAEKILRFLPPYIIERRHVDQAFTALDTVFEQGPEAANQKG